MDTNIEASKSLIEQAMRNENMAIAIIQIASACKLDTSLDINKIERAYFKLWQEQQYNERIKGEQHA